MNVERWVDLPEYPTYQVSTRGNIRRIVGGTPRKVQATLTALGFVRVTLLLSGQPRKTPYLHELVGAVFLGEPPEPNAVVQHRNKNRADNHVGNLRWGPAAARSGRRPGSLLPPNQGEFGRNKTHCPRGHLLQAPNLSPSHKNRMCLACQKAYNSGWGTRVRRNGGSPTRDPQFKARADEFYAAIMGVPITQPHLDEAV